MRNIDWLHFGYVALVTPLVLFAFVILVALVVKALDGHGELLTLV